eukprot:TRINITY_DN17584_c0_g2_i6.p1 TRINITY_DN17584_c0_g2~~TRINITY_DN17584_c0_g2_i6.p1  ORF type:complete len:120 (-),score=9.70 TRINITY_DN17584_c0_g2_i6:375-734(-)
MLLSIHSMSNISYLLAQEDFVNSLIKMLSDYYRGLGPLGPSVIRRFTTVRFISEGLGDKLNKEELKLLSDYIYHTVVVKPFGEHCLDYIYSFGAFTRKPLLKRFLSSGMCPRSSIWASE